MYTKEVIKEYIQAFSKKKQKCTGNAVCFYTFLKHYVVILGTLI